MSRLTAPLTEPGARYADVMMRIRERFDAIQIVREGPASWTLGETIGTHLRKIIEGIAFGCVIATEYAVKNVPRKVVGQWDAETIFTALKKSGDFPYPDPNRIRRPTAEEISAQDVNLVVEGVVENRITVDDMRSIYRRTHAWTHEDNPYVNRPSSERNLSTLLQDVDRVERMLRLHRIGIQGKSFLLILRDEKDGLLKVQAIEKIAEI